jgi:hypothetical protein
MYECFARFLLDVYKIPEGCKNAGHPLAPGVQLNYMGIIMNHAGNKYKANGSPQSKLFLQCLDTNSSSESAVWYKKLKTKMWRICFERSKAAGEVMDQSAGITWNTIQ